MATTHTMSPIPVQFRPAAQKVFTLSSYKVWVTTECEDEDPHRFAVDVEAPDAATAMKQVGANLGWSYMQNFAEGVVTGPAWMSWHIEGREAEGERTLFTAVPA